MGYYLTKIITGHITGTYRFRPLAEDDLPMLSEWLSRPHLQKWWSEQETGIQSLKEKYLPRIHGQDDARPFIIRKDEEDLGYIQYYSVTHGNPEWWPDKPGPGILGIDQFIADEQDLGHGMGSAFISEFCHLLFQGPDINEIRVDPSPDNHGAIRCYEKAGFTKINLIDTPAGAALMMILTEATQEN
ncbi:GNAT family N-acetyltransferase [Balneola sp. MJW-20]|uniref:GNAT family N-acetyltransferase n=1 Tax=Gracilimonas aurantiaca TaxID=3234185 RepID=UPI003467CCC2